ncbi:peptidoglycan-binding protein [Microbacterium sp.]|uniref:peptidoglycan-binding protein n=1 Tax=Microbacterium sp. TaxID=51671 RepID=UPI0039E2A6BF
MTRRRRAAVASIAAVVVVGVVVAGLWLWQPWRAGADETAARTEPVTAPVERASLTDRLELNAQLTYGDPVPLPPAEGMVTALPAAGEVVGIGGRLYERDGRPVVLLRGERPFWRDLAVDDQGEDVRQLQQNLAALGFFDGDADGWFGRRTAEAVRAWQRSLGVERTGAFARSDVAVTPGDGIRVSRVTARLGDVGASPATVTGTALHATARLTAAQARRLAVGTAVTVGIAGADPIEATLTAVDPGGTPTGDGDEQTPPTATVDFPDQGAVSAAGPVAVRLEVHDSAAQPETLVVPVTALVALPGDGYAVEVATGDEVVRTAVEIGLVADARVQVLRSGTQVEGGDGPVLEAGDLVVLAR